MTERKEYAIVRFFEQGGKCYKIDDVAEGCNLMQFMKNEERIEKKELYSWFSSLSAQLELYHRSMKQGYGHVNPYAEIINEEGKASLLDIEAKENSDLLKRMQKKSFRSLFVKKGSCDGQLPKPEDDVFGFGKLLLFLLEKGKFETEFTGIEKIKLKRIVEKCTNKAGNAGAVFKSVQKELNKMDKNDGGKRTFGVKIIIVVIAMMAGLVIFAVLNSQSAKKEQEITTMETEKTIVFEEEGERLFLELGMLYYAELGDSASAREILNNVKGDSKAADIYLQIFDYIQKGSNLDEKQWNEMWQDLKEEWKKLGVENKLWYKLPILEACKLRNTTECCNIICEIGEDVKANRKWNGILDDPGKEAMLCQYLGEAYETLGDEEKALQEYQRWKILETKSEQLEQIYLKILALSETAKDVENEPEIMRAILEEAVEKVPMIKEHTEFCEWMEKYEKQEEDTLEETTEQTMEENIVETVE